MPRRFGYRSSRIGYRGRTGYHRNTYRSYRPRYYQPYSAGNYSYNRYGLGRRHPYPWMRDLEDMAAASRRRRERIAREREESEERRPRSAEEREDKERERRENRRKEEERLEKEKKEAEELLELMKEEERRAKAERERLERERRKKRPLSVNDVDLNIVENSKAHHTDKYDITQLADDESELVVRRGQEFNITLKLDQEYDKDRHDLALNFKTGMKSSIIDGTDVSITVDESGRKPTDPNDWHARLVSQDQTNVTVGVFSPSNCIIGEWSLYVTAQNKTTDGNIQEEQFECSTDINILLNPWCKEDRVYMKDTKKLDEYCLNDHGVVFQGSSKSIGAKIWNFAQFEKEILEICFGLLRKSNDYKVGSHMSDPIRIARDVSAIINVNQDHGVLVGNWTGNYQGGTQPTAWTNSADILLKYKESGGQGVKYGQCWVFSAVVTTVCRAIGLPCKSVTCFDSAHDTDGSTTIDNIFVKNEDGYLNIDRTLSNDSIWNFHVWNEVWMKRPDLKDEYHGWQVIDATPQELSDGISRCGPAPVAAIKTGNCKMVYDIPFVFAEVNSDVINWERVNRHTWRQMYRETRGTGSRIYSKYPDGEPYKDDLTIKWGALRNNRHDVTSDYKFPEGSREERLAVANAAQAATSHRGVQKLEDVTIEVAVEDGVMVGEDFTLNFKIKNSSNGERKISKLHVDLYSKFYTGEIKSKISSTSLYGFTLNGKQDKSLSESVSTKKYLDKLAEQANMEVIVSAKVTTENGKHSDIVKVDNFRLRRPDIDIKMPSACKKGEELTVQLSFRNYLPIPMTKCVLNLGGPGFQKMKEIAQKDVPPQSEWKMSVKVTAKRKGLEQFSAAFDSQEVPDITGKAEVQIT